jgi:glycosyltransferase involved in cell wall biosynthesis
MNKIKTLIKLILLGEVAIIKQKFYSIAKLFLKSTKARFIQNTYNLNSIKKAQKLVVFLVPGQIELLGGIMTIFQACKISKEVYPDALHLIATFPGYFTYEKNNKFRNEEVIFRFSQITKNLYNAQEVILHIPEFYAAKFYSDLSKSEKNKFPKIKNLTINILNQNINFMPQYDLLKNLYQLSSNVTHSVGFERYANQNISDQYKLPLYYIPSFLDLENCIVKKFDKKEKIILYSSDPHPMKNTILKLLQENLIDFRLKEIKNLTYEEFLEAIADSMFCLSFGEGFDGYYIQPYFANSIGIAVYNDIFFPKEEMKKLPFVYENFKELSNNIVNDIQAIYKNSEQYENTSKNTLSFLKNNINKRENTLEGLKKLYSLEPDFINKKEKTRQELKKVYLSTPDSQKRFVFNEIDNTKQDNSILTAIIFTYNHGDSIKRCIESLLNQKTTYPYKINIWDDCSSDDTSIICIEYAKANPDKIILNIQKENTFLKPYYELQSYEAIQKIRTKYFCIIDGDDYWLDENKIQIAINFLENNDHYIGFAHDTLIVDKFNFQNLSHVHDCLKWKVQEHIDFSVEAPFLLTSSRIFRNCGYIERNLLPIDYLVYYFHLSKGPIYYYDKIMAAYVHSQSSTFVSQGLQVRNLNSMFYYRLSKLFDFKQDKFCTQMQKKADTTNHIGKKRYFVLLFLKKIFGTRYGWHIWFYLTFVTRYGRKCADIHYVYCHQKAKNKMDHLSKG